MAPSFSSSIRLISARFLDMALSPNLVKRLRGSVQCGGLARVTLPAQHGDIHIDRIDLHGRTPAPGGFGGDEGGPATPKGVVDPLSGGGVVEDGPAHALDRLLRAV